MATDSERQPPMVAATAVTDLAADFRAEIDAWRNSTDRHDEVLQDIVKRWYGPQLAPYITAQYQPAKDHSTPDMLLISLRNP